jgi:hypothetical protein
MYKVDPRFDSLARNLLSKDDWRFRLSDEPGKTWPKVSWVLKPSSSACRAERLARTGAGPHWSVVGPSCVSQGEAPHADAGEEMALGESDEVCRCDIFNTPFVNNTGRDMPGGNKVAQPLCCVRVKFVVVSGQSLLSSICTQAYARFDL